MMASSSSVIERGPTLYTNLVDLLSICGLAVVAEYNCWLEDEVRNSWSDNYQKMLTLCILLRKSCPRQNAAKSPAGRSLGMVRRRLIDGESKTNGIRNFFFRVYNAIDPPGMPRTIMPSASSCNRYFRVFQRAVWRIAIGRIWKLVLNLVGKSCRDAFMNGHLEELQLMRRRRRPQLVLVAPPGFGRYLGLLTRMIRLLMFELLPSPKAGSWTLMAAANLYFLYIGATSSFNNSREFAGFIELAEQSNSWQWFDLRDWLLDQGCDLFEENEDYSASCFCATSWVSEDFIAADFMASVERV